MVGYVLASLVQTSGLSSGDTTIPLSHIKKNTRLKTVWIIRMCDRERSFIRLQQANLWKGSLTLRFSSPDPDAVFQHKTLTIHFHPQMLLNLLSSSSRLFVSPPCCGDKKFNSRTRFDSRSDWQQTWSRNLYVFVFNSGANQALPKCKICFFTMKNTILFWADVKYFCKVRDTDGKMSNYWPTSKSIK